MGLFKALTNGMSEFMYNRGWSRKSYDDEYEYGHDDGREDEDYDEAEPERKSYYNPTDTRRFTVMFDEVKDKRDSSFAERNSDKIRHISTGPQTPKTYITKPQSIDECCVISEKLQSGCQIVVNLNDIKHDVAQRIVDFLAGVTHGLGGSIEDASNKIYVLAPKSWDIECEIEEVMEYATFLPTFRTGRR